MHYFTPSRQRARSALFEDQLASTIEVLSSEEIINRLGCDAVILAAECEKAFLPNVRHGVVELPIEQVGTDNISYLPLLVTDGRRGSVRISAALGAPSDVTIQRAHDTTGVNLIEQYNREAGRKPRNTRGSTWKATTASHRMLLGSGQDQCVATGRSMVFRAAISQDPIHDVATIAHEFRHAVDYRDHQTPPRVLTRDYADRIHRAAMEIRGYRVAHAILDAHGMHRDVEARVMDIWTDFNLESSSGWDIPFSATVRADELGILD